MKKALSILASCAVLCLAPAQTSNPNTVKTGRPVLPVSKPYAIAEQGVNHRVWQRETYERTPNGVVVTNVHRYVELATGLNYLKNGRWVESKEEIKISPDGSSASAIQGQHQAYFPGDIYNGVIKLVMPDGKVLLSRPLGLSLFDGSNSVLIAELKDVTGELVGSNQVVYRDAFEGIKADLRYTYTRAGFEQDIILREQSPDPLSFGLNPETCRLELMTEFFKSPQPKVFSGKMRTPAGELTDEILSFGTMCMGRGKAFALGQNRKRGGTEVNKQWMRLNGRQFLVEEVPVKSIADELSKLPLPPTSSVKPNPPLNVVSAKRLLPPQRLATSPDKHRMQVAGNIPLSPGMVLDYEVVSRNVTDYTFQSDTTYYLSGPVYYGGTNNVFEGGAVLKYDYDASLSAWGWPVQISCRTSPYRPVILTAKDDNSVGEILPGSTGTPTNYYAVGAIEFSPGTSPITFAHFRIAHAQGAIAMSSITSPLTIADGQIVNCQTAISVNGGNCCLHNILIADTMYAITAGGAGLSVNNTTFCGSANLLAGWSASVHCTNCIFANITNVNLSPYVSVGGGYNGFYNCQEFGSNTRTNDFYPFQTVGGGNYYLTNGCNFFNAGTTNIAPSLLADLRTTTTYPPQFLTNGTIASATWEPTVPRDTSGQPDLGYHYSPLDYLVMGGVCVNDLTLTNGVAVGIINVVSSYFSEQALDSGCLNSQGTALNHNHVCSFYAVQELSTHGDNNALFLDLGSLQARFTDFDTVGKPFFMLLSPSYIDIRDCNFGAGELDFYGVPTMICNNVFERTAVSILAYGSYSGPLNFHNNLFKGNRRVDFYDYSSTAWWVIQDNAFDNCATPNFSLQGNNDILGYNAYINVPGVSWANDTDVVLPGFNYAAGPLGNYYQLSTNLLDVGSATADQLGLYHYTVVTNEIREGQSRVDIGYHYAATGCSDTAVDTIWVEDAVPAGAIEDPPWTWVSQNPAPYSGALAHQTESYGYDNFESATNTLAIDPGDNLITYVYLDPTNTPASIIVAWWKDAYSVGIACWGNHVVGTFMGSLPPAGQWVRLAVPASILGLEGVILTGMWSESDGGRAIWDRSGKVKTQCYDTDDDGIPDYIEDGNGNGLLDPGETDPRNPDTDGDGWDDAFEEQVSHTDPTNPDTDGDGVNDYIEYLEGRNPLVAGAVPDTQGAVNLQIYTPLH